MVAEPLLAEKKLRSAKRALDDATEEMIRHAENMGIETVFTRQAKYDESFLGIGKSRCHFGSSGVCCRQCAMGPCRIWLDDLPMMYRLTTPRLDKGTCGAGADTIVARNLLMMVGRGTAAHASHARHAASALLKTAQGKTSYKIKDTGKLLSIAAKLKFDNGQDIENTAVSVSSQALSDITGNEDAMNFAVSYCPESTGKNLKALGVIPGSVGAELLAEGHETSMGTMTDPTSLILHAARLGVADIASLIISSEFQDVLFGIPGPVTSRIGFNVLDKSKVNVVIHGHVPLLSEKLIELSDDDELLNKARALGASGINIVGCCCTGNEVLMRHGVPLAGSNLQQELVIATGLVEAFVADVQCIYPNVENVAARFHTKIITTMKEARLAGATHIPFEDEHADEAARKILEAAVENFRKRGNNTYLPKNKPEDLVAGFSVETCLSVLSKINREDPLKPLIDNIASGNIYGAVLLAGCTSPRVTADASHVAIAKALMKNNVLIIATGCAAQACARAGLLTPEASQYAGDKLKGVLALLGETAGLGKPLPPVWHFGSCVDNGRVVVLVSALAEKLGVPIRDLPIAASAAEWVTEKAAAIGTGAVALGVTVHLGVTPPVIGSPNVTALLTQKSEELFGGKFIVEVNPDKAAKHILDHIKKAREKLGLAI
ncbi:MAG TPA: anaerobic carbon-monoxide dehydrogenase catalytic subunit [Candidatus Methanoperedens sp.]